MAHWTTGPALARTALAAAVSGLALGASPGQAATAPLATEPETAALASAACEQTGITSLAAARPLQPAAPASKSAAILGGQPSALDRIRMLQSASPAMPQPAAAIAATGHTQRKPLAPAAGGFRVQAAGCAGWRAPDAGMAMPRPAVLSGDDFLASKRLAIGRTGFDRDWQRVRNDEVSKARYRALIGDGAHGRSAILSRVNAWVNDRIVYTEDRNLFSRADFWAGAKKTLELGRGDCEDIALTKMQLLAAAGIPRRDMFLTIARDLVRNADHAVLIVRHEGGFVMLDDGSDALLDASQAHDYRPILSFSGHQVWLHGY
ncbi:hypothetical protein GRI75_08105 [Altererythrobacter soli]|uniref:Transglutaminase n=1 Tax=Croceibacterium soli TaxID=1739690 RepID=A0A6I4UUW6_9SPHN|nr:transglutaminase-like cysteine peptidase [Croceibacterium soli]MXP41604.1 hypothetical protein [Croceibacterium soli]